MLILHTISDACVQLSLLAQDGGAPAGTGATPAVDPPLFSSPIFLLTGIFILFYLIVLLPEKRRKREFEDLKSAIKKNDRVITAGGIHATVAAAPPDSDVITIRIDESGSTRVKINRSAIATIVTDKESQDGGSKDASSETKND